MLSGLVSYVVGYLFYATAVHGSMMLLARLFAGVYNGVTHTLVYAYFGQSFVEYVAALKELNRDCHPRCKDMLFSLHGISMSLGYIVGLGMIIEYLFSITEIMKGVPLVHLDCRIVFVSPCPVTCFAGLVGGVCLCLYYPAWRLALGVL